MSGVLVKKGIQILIPIGGLKISNGEMKVNVEVRYEVCPKWLELSLDHLLNSKVNKNNLIFEYKNTGEVNSELLEKEFSFSMQSIMASSIALDAFYNSVKEHVNIPKELTELWRRKRTSRHSQIAEVLKRAFLIKPKGMINLKKCLKEIFKFRDLAVHPSAKSREPIMHPELNVGVEWRYISFSYESAKSILTASLEIMWQLINSKSLTNPKIIDYCKSLNSLLKPIFEEWMNNYGPLESMKEKNIEI